MMKKIYSNNFIRGDESHDFWYFDPPTYQFKMTDAPDGTDPCFWAVSWEEAQEKANKLADHYNIKEPNLMAGVMLSIGLFVFASFAGLWLLAQAMTAPTVDEVPSVGTVDKCYFSEPIPPYKGVCTWAGQPVR